MYVMIVEAYTTLQCLCLHVALNKVVLNMRECVFNLKNNRIVCAVSTPMGRWLRLWTGKVSELV